MTKACISSTALNTIMCVDVRNIIVLVAGTTDPFNLLINDPAGGHRAHSYGNSEEDSNWYWGGELNKHFRENLDALKNDLNIILFPMHGWSGDNSVDNRTKAGLYLANRLTGAGDKSKAYYAGFLKDKIALHFIGHSHGGNVINEFTRQALELSNQGNWPVGWKIASITYLSTPFFKKLHQLQYSDKTFYPKCKVKNVYCDYDLTQRMIADFSLHQLTGLLDKVDLGDVTDPVWDLLNFKYSDIVKGFLVGPTDVDPSWKIDFEWLFKDGENIYLRTITMLENLRNILLGVKKVFTDLNQEIEFHIDNLYKGKHGITHKRKVVSDSVRKQAHDMIDLVINGLNPTINNLTSRVKAKRVSGQPYNIIDEYIPDFEVNKFVTPLVNLLGIDPITLEPTHPNGLLNVFYETFKQQIVAYDDTLTSPLEQIKNTPLKDYFTSLDVTKNDEFYTHSAKRDPKLESNFRIFILGLKMIEEDYFKNQSKRNFLDMLFYLISNYEGLPEIMEKVLGFKENIDTLVKYAKKLKTTPAVSNFIARCTDIATIIDSFNTIYTTRHSGKMLDEKHVPNKVQTLQRGSLAYFMIESHSTSRRKLHPDVKKHLQSAFKAGKITIKKLK